MTSTGVAVAVEHDFVPVHFESLRCKAENPFCASHQFEEALASFTNEEMMVRTFGTLIVRRDSLHFDHARFAVTCQFLEAPIDGGNPQGGN